MASIVFKNARRLEPHADALQGGVSVRVNGDPISMMSAQPSKVLRIAVVVDGNPLRRLELLTGQREHLPAIMKGGRNPRARPAPEHVRAAGSRIDEPVRNGS